MTRQNSYFSIAIYRESQYALLREVSADKETFSISYDHMMSITDAKCKEIEERGFKAVRIYVDVDELIAWCDARGMKLTPESRTRFTLEKLKEMIKVLG